MSADLKNTDRAAATLPDDWAAALAGTTKRQREAMARIRALVLDVADEVSAGPLTEALKWGQPSWLTEATGAGTTLRMGAVGDDRLALYVHCQTDLLGRYRTQFPEVFEFEGNRAVLVPLDGDWPELPLRAVIGQALTYKRDKKRART